MVSRARIPSPSPRQSERFAVRFGIGNDRGVMRSGLRVIALLMGAALLLALASPADARAQLETMRSFSHPFAWAAFGVTGVPR